MRGCVGRGSGDRRAARPPQRDLERRDLKPTMHMTIAPEPFDSADARHLIEALDAHLASRYTAEQRFGPNLKPAQVAPGLGAFLMARIDGRPVGCGAVRLVDPSTAEVKR